MRSFLLAIVLASLPDAASAAGESASKAIMYVEDGTAQGSEHAGSAVWRLERQGDASGPGAETVVKAEIDIPGQLHARIFWRRNPNPNDIASRFVDISIDMRPGWQFGSIAKVHGLLMKKSNNVRGTPLAGNSVQVAPGVFMIGLTADPRSTDLLTHYAWFDIPISFSGGRRVILAVDKGAAGTRAFTEAAAAWDRPALAPSGPSNDTVAAPQAAPSNGGMPPKASDFPYERYEAADLDELIEQRRPETGADIYGARRLKLAVTLAAYAERCDAAFMKRTMLAAGIAKDKIGAASVTGCIKIRSAKGQVLPVFIQDRVAEFLPKEVPLGSQITLFAIHLFTNRDGPGLLVNEFQAGDGNKSAGCGCGTSDFHPGTDYTAAEGTPVRVPAEGVVVKVENNEQAVVDLPSAGRCGRYVVVKHSYANGRSVFVRFAQLGRIIGEGGRSIAVGMHLAKEEQIGVIGSNKTLHMEVRPVDSATRDTGQDWTRRFGTDPTMEWTQFRSVDPRTFDVDTFGGTGAVAK